MMWRCLPAVAAGLVALLLHPTLSHAQGWADSLAMEPPALQVDNYELRLEGFAYGAGYTPSFADLPPMSDADESGFVGQVQARLRLQRIYDSGLIVGGWASFLLAHDELSGDNYGNDTIQKAYLYLQTGLGRVEIGQQDGVAYQIGVTAPTVDDHISLENPDSVLFRDPTGDGAFQSYAFEVTRLNSSSNAAKLSYLTPRLFGAQIGMSFTPNLVKSPLPFLGNPSNRPNQQGSLWESIASYNTFFGDMAVGMSAAYTHGALRNPLPGATDLSDWSFGLQFAKPVGGTRLSGGVSYRTSNAVGFSPLVHDGKANDRIHAGLMIEIGTFSFGGELSHTNRNGAGLNLDVEFDAYQLAASYRPNENLYLSVGWQFYDYSREVGTFYSGNRRAEMNAGFLTLGYQIP